MKTEHRKIATFLQEQRQTDDNVESQFPIRHQWANESQTLDNFMTYVKESLKFILFSFFKRCRIIIKILVSSKENTMMAPSPLDRHRMSDGHGLGGQKQTRESIIADMLAQNLKWAFLTIKTCIDKSEAQMESKQEQMKNENNDETGEGQAQMPIMADLVCFQKILLNL